MQHASAGDSIEAALAHNGEVLRLMMDSIPDFLFIKDRDLRFVRTNVAHAKMMGLASPDEVVGKNDFDVFPELEAGAIQEREKTVIETGRPVYSMEYEVSNRSGQVFYLSGHRIPIKDARGEVVGPIGLVRDITGVKKMEQELRNVNMRLSSTLSKLKHAHQKVIQHERLKALGEMASGVAHDFNNALMPILGYTDVLISRPEILHKTDDVMVMLKDIRIAAMDAAQAVRRLREFYRTALENERYSGDLNRQIETAVILTRPRWQSEMSANGIKINVETELSDIPPVNAKESQLREILINLVLNAVDAMPDGGSITIKTCRDRDTVVLEVCDTGVGMSEDVRHRCFEPFFTTKGEDGTGLGLSMVYGFVKRHKGSIDIVSAPGSGTRVIIRLPVETAVLPSQEHLELPLAAVPPLRILVLDDEPSARRLLDRYLKTDKHLVEVAADGKEGLAKFMKSTFDLVITDRAMTDMSGDQVALAIREVNQAIPIIMITGFGDIMNDNRQCPPGVTMVVSKPITHADLRHCIATVVGK